MFRIRRCHDDERGAILAIVNAAAEAYRGVIPADRWHEPYMPGAELDAEIAAGVAFWGCEVGGELVGVMGVQPVRDVDLIRHAYVAPAHQGRGIGGALLEHLLRRSTRRVLVGTWAAADRAIRFYRRHGFELVDSDRAAALLKAYWTIPVRQVESSVVLAWRSGVRVAAMRRLLIWSGIDGWRAEAATVDLAAGGLSARGTQLGVDPVPYRLDYELEVGEDWITRRLRTCARGADWMRELDLRHDGEGRWTATTAREGDVVLPPPGGDVATVNGALDCDLGLCPLTNVMPVRRHGLHERPAETDFLMAWVSVPDLGLHASRQRYEHVGRRGDRLVVRYVGEHRSFVGELELDHDGFVLLYPGLARRVE